MMRHGLMVALLIFVLGFVNYQIYGKEQQLAQGQPILLELAPVDPRSLIQGDYMVLRYAIAEDIAKDFGDGNTAVVALDGNDVARYVRIHNANRPLADGELLLNFDRRSSTFLGRTDEVLIGAESFFFQEGEAEVFDSAEYGELIVNENGGSILVGLRNGAFEPLGRE